MHVLEAGFEERGRPWVLLLHGFPGARLLLAKGDGAARRGRLPRGRPDQRGYGRTTGWDADYDGDLASFRMLNLVRDTLGLVSAFGYRRSPPWSGTILARPSRPVARWCGPTSSARSR